MRILVSNTVSAIVPPPTTKSTFCNQVLSSKKIKMKVVFGHQSLKFNLIDVMMNAFRLLFR